MIGTAKVLGEVKSVLGAPVRDDHHRLPLSFDEAGAERVRETVGHFTPDLEPIDDHEQLPSRRDIDAQALHVACYRPRDVQRLTVYEQPHEAQSTQVRDHELVRDLPASGQWERDLDARPRRQLPHAVHGFADGIGTDLPVALGAVCSSYA